jgi:hypothetical protein
MSSVAYMILSGEETGVVINRKLAPLSRQSSSTFHALDSDVLAKKHTPVVCQVSYSSDIAPCDFCLFPPEGRILF